MGSGLRASVIERSSVLTRVRMIDLDVLKAGRFRAGQRPNDEAIIWRTQPLLDSSLGHSEMLETLNCQVSGNMNSCRWSADAAERLIDLAIRRRTITTRLKRIRRVGSDFNSIVGLTCPVWS